MMPGDWESPKDESAENGLAKDDWKDIALTGEEPAHGGAADPRERNEDGIGPVERREERASNNGRDFGIRKGAEQTVHCQGLQGDLLQETKREIAEEAPRLDQMSRQAMEPTESHTGEKESSNKDEKNGSGKLRCGFEIVYTPAERSGIVAVQSKA